MYAPKSARFGCAALTAFALVLSAGAWTHARQPQRGDAPHRAGRRPTTQRADRDPAWRAARAARAAGKRGLIIKTNAAFDGYTLFAPFNSTKTHLIDLDGNPVHTWDSKYEPGEAVYLLDDGRLLRCGREPDNRNFMGGGLGGRVERLAPDGSIEWEFVYADDKHCLHHDIEPLPNGNILMIAWVKKSADEGVAAGRDPNLMEGDELWPDCIIEVQPAGKSGGKTVWEWHVWDHLVQEFDESKPNYGVVAEHPELVDLNHLKSAPRETPAEISRLRALGYIGGKEDEFEDDGRGRRRRPRNRPQHLGADWCHTNSVSYNARLDQIALSVLGFNEVWIIDHSTTKEEAASHKGGRSGKGGDLLYRWGNPRAYGAGTAEDQKLFSQHDARWIPNGLPGAGHLMIFNNGGNRKYSSVVEIELPIDSAGRFERSAEQAFGPAKPCWEYVAKVKAEFFSGRVSGAERLPNGNTLICSGGNARIFEVDKHGNIVWEYVNAFEENGHSRVPPDPRMAGPPPPGGRPGPGGRGGRSGTVFRATRLAPDHPGVKVILKQ